MNHTSPLLSSTMIPASALAITFLTTVVLAHAELSVELVAKGFDRPVWAGVPEGIKGKLWVMEQDGKVWIVNDKTGEREAKPFLDVSAEIGRASCRERV